MRHLILILALILCSACNRTLPPEAKCGFLMTKEGRRVSWDKKVPVMLAVNAFIVGDNAVTIIKESAQAWNTAAGRELIRIVNDTSK